MFPLALPWSKRCSIGKVRQLPPIPPTDTISVNGGSVTGDLIGTSDFPGFPDTAQVTYRADITSLVSSGANNLEIDGVDFAASGNPGDKNDGAGVLVIVLNVTTMDWAIAWT